MRFFKRKKQSPSSKAIPDLTDEIAVKPLQGVDQKLKWLALTVIFTPMIFGLIFNFIQVLGQSNSQYICYMTEADYMTFIALQSGKNSMGAFMPFSLWSMLNIIIMQIVGGILLIYEIHVMIANRKRKTKESLLKRHKKVILRFFSSLLLLYVISDYYISIKRPEAVKQTNFLVDSIADRQLFFANCDSTGDIHIAKQSKLVEKETNYELP